MEKIRTHRNLKVFQLSFEAGMEIFRTSKSFPKKELYSLTDQIRRSSRSVSGNIAEAFRSITSQMNQVFVIVTCE
jgi:four helix bundle protein